MAYQRRRTKKVKIDNAKLQWRPNFRGNPEFNFSPEDHSRNFTVILEDDNPLMRYGYSNEMKTLRISDLQNDGWNVKFTKPDEEGNVTAYLPVTVSYKKRPPTIIKAIGGPDIKVSLDEDSVGDLDEDYIINIDTLTINGSPWENSSGSGTKAYLMNMFVTVEDDPFMREYGDLSDDAPAVVASAIDDDLPF